MEASTTTAARSARGRRPARVSGDERERAILATAERLLGERSLHEISVDDLARGAGISRPTFYFYFASKEAVLLALMDRLVAEARSGIELGMLARDPRGVVRRGIASVHDTFREHRPVALASIDVRAKSPAVRELWSRVMEGFVDESTAAIESERARGAAPQGVPARDLAIALNLMNERVFHASLSGEAPAIDEDAELDALVAIWLLAIYGTTDPPSAVD
ncbi:MAG TPA: TetR/AcrR family transcriptional regulator [Solirubrobacteraceae bacterium]|jgi:AcrR family transcriptional regulator|nr:TetR/AcrR family transcriptional regulator [Solirubrobacteraceae bacterium]